VGARGFLILGANARLRARGTTGGVGDPSVCFPGPGSGGGIRVHGRPVVTQPGAAAEANVDGGLGRAWSSSVSYSGGGRALLEGRPLLFTVGETASVAALTSGIAVSGSSSNAAGTIDATPQLTVVPPGQSLVLAPSVLQAQGGNLPGVRLRRRDVRALPGSTLSVPANHHNRGELWLDARSNPPADPPAVQVTGVGPLVNEDVIRGSGRIEVTLQNAAGAQIRIGRSELLRLDGAANTNAGEIDVVEGLLRTTTDLSNGTGGEINLIDATLECASPLTGGGALRAIDSTIAPACTPP
jgi:hypothetical protein